MTGEQDGGRIVHARVDEWRRRLIDLTYRNRLIKYRPTRASTIEIESPDLQTLLGDLARTAPWRFYFPPEPSEPDGFGSTSQAGMETPPYPRPEAATSLANRILERRQTSEQ